MKPTTEPIGTFQVLATHLANGLISRAPQGKLQIHGLETLEDGGERIKMENSAGVSAALTQDKEFLRISVRRDVITPQGIEKLATGTKVPNGSMGEAALMAHIDAVIKQCYETGVDAERPVRNVIA